MMRIASRPMKSLKRFTPPLIELQPSAWRTYGPSISPYFRTSAGKKLFLQLRGARGMQVGRNARGAKFDHMCTDPEYGKDGKEMTQPSLNWVTSETHLPSLQRTS